MLHVVLESTVTTSHFKLTCRRPDLLLENEGQLYLQTRCGSYSMVIVVQVENMVTPALLDRYLFLFLLLPVSLVVTGESLNVELEPSFYEEAACFRKQGRIGTTGETA